MLSFEEILKRLTPLATSGWLKRFQQMRNRGPKMWLLVLRDFDIQSPEVEYAVNDVIREIEILQPNKSLVRAEMEKLEKEGKLKLDTPEEEAYWESRLEAERKKYQEWKTDDNNAYMKQKKSDLEFLKKKHESENSPVPMARPEQDPKKNTEINTVIQPEIPVNEQPVPQSEAEKQQAAYIPKPPPDKEPPIIKPKLKSIVVNGEEVYNADKTPAPRKKIEEVEGMPADAADRLKNIGVATEEALKVMDRAQAKSILGVPLYTRLQSIFTSPA